MRRSATRSLVIRHILLMASVASVVYGLTSWHALAFDTSQVWLYNNDWRPHPVHFVALGLGLMAPSLWEIFVLSMLLGTRQAPGDGTAPPRTAKPDNAVRQSPAASGREQLASVQASGHQELAAAEDAAAQAASRTEVSTPPRTFVRPIQAADRRELLSLAQDGRDFHTPWIRAPLTAHTFKMYLRRTERDDHKGYAICLRDSGEMVGVVNVNNILRGSMLSASIAYYVAKGCAGQGYMREGLLQVKEHAFRQLGLHRLEANIQPGNTASIALVRSCGFVREGVSSRLLYIDGAWRDHERWAAVDTRPGLGP